MRNPANSKCRALERVARSGKLLYPSTQAERAIVLSTQNTTSRFNRMSGNVMTAATKASSTHALILVLRSPRCDVIQANKSGGTSTFGLTGWPRYLRRGGRCRKTTLKKTRIVSRGGCPRRAFRRRLHATEQQERFLSTARYEGLGGSASNPTPHRLQNEPNFSFHHLGGMLVEALFASVVEHFVNEFCAAR